MLQARVHFGFSETLLVGKYPSPLTHTQAHTYKHLRVHTHTQNPGNGRCLLLRVWP